MYKLVLLDFSMPDMDGPEVAIKLRKLLNDVGLDAPTICCCTAYTEEK